MNPEAMLGIVAQVVTTMCGYVALHTELRKLRHDVERMENETAEAVTILRERIATVEGLRSVHG